MPTRTVESSAAPPRAWLGCAAAADSSTPTSTTHHDDKEAIVPMDNRPFAITISAAELASKDDREGAMILLRDADVPAEHLADAALQGLAYVMSGDGAPGRYAQLRADVHELADRVGATDSQVVLCMEVIAAAEALTNADVNVACALLAGSTFSPLVIANAAVSFTGMAVASWMGERAPAFFAALRREYGVEAA